MSRYTVDQFNDAAAHFGERLAPFLRQPEVASMLRQASETEATLAAIRAWAISSDSSTLSQSLVYKTAQEEVLDLLASAPAEKPVE